MKQIRIILSGKVQGIGLRENVRKEASVLNVRGWVKNKKDGTVEIVAQGDTRSLDKFTDFCKRGSFLAHVQNADVKEEAVEEEFEVFQIRHI